MIGIEIKRSGRDGFIILTVLILLFLAMMSTDKESYMAPALEVFLLLYASFSGWSLFERERQENALEYLLSLPLSRLKMLLIKFSVRLFFLAVVLIFHFLIHKEYAIHFLLPFIPFFLLFLTVFMLSFTLSLSLKGFLTTFFISLFLSVGLYQFIGRLDFSKSQTHMALQTLVSYLVIPVIFVFFFRKVDIKPISYFNRKYIPLFVVAVFLVFGVTYLTTHVSWWHCYLSDDGELFRVSRKKTVMIDQDGNKQIVNHSLEPLLQRNRNLYASLYGGQDRSGKLVRFDLNSREFHNLATIEPGYWFHSFIDTRAVFKDKIYFLLTNRNHKRYKILEIGKNQSRVIPVKGDFGKEKFHMICGVSGNPLQFIVMTLSPSNHATGSRVFRIREDGSADFLFAAESIAFWEGKLLRFTGEKIILYRAGQSFKEMFSQPGDYRRCRRKFENYIQKKVILKEKNQYYVFDLQDQTMQSLDIRKIPYYYSTIDDDGLRLVWTNGPEISVSTWRNGHLQVENTWYTGIEGLKIIRVFKSGILVYHRNEYEVFLLENGDEGGEPRK